MAVPPQTPQTPQNLHTTPPSEPEPVPVARHHSPTRPQPPAQSHALDHAQPPVDNSGQAPGPLAAPPWITGVAPGRSAAAIVPSDAAGAAGAYPAVLSSGELDDLRALCDLSEGDEENWEDREDPALTPHADTADSAPGAGAGAGIDTMSRGETAAGSARAAAPGMTGPPPMSRGGEQPADDFDRLLIRRTRRAPKSGWRKVVHDLSGGLINLGPSGEEVALAALERRVRQPVRGDYRIACLSLKGGVGKTTTTIGLGATFAALRGDRVIAIDANPDLGTLAQRVTRQTDSTVRDLITDPTVHRYGDVRAHTSQSPDRLEVLASERDPAVSEAFSEEDYRRAVDVLRSFYNLILTDCGTGLMHSAMRGVLDLADCLVLVTSPALDGARSAWATLDWLAAHGHEHLVERTVVVMCESRSGSAVVNTDEVQRMFAARCAAVHVLPHDPHFAEGAEVELELLDKRTRRALTELAASVADGFSRPRRT